MDIELSKEEVVRVVDNAVNELLAAAEVLEPPVDTYKLAERHFHWTICKDRQEWMRGRPINVKADPTHIRLDPDETFEFRQWTVAAAIGEHVKPQLLQSLGIDPKEKRGLMGVSLSNLFAERLLLPTQWFEKDASECGYDVLYLAQCYNTATPGKVAFRLLDMPEPCVISAVDDDLVMERRSNGPRVNKRKLLPPEIACQKRVSKTRAPHVERDDRWTVQGWPFNNGHGDWQILRSVRDD